MKKSDQDRKAAERELKFLQRKLEAAEKVRKTLDRPASGCASCDISTIKKRINELCKIWGFNPKAKPNP